MPQECILDFFAIQTHYLFSSSCRFLSLSAKELNNPVVHRLANWKQGIIGKWVATRECCLLLPMILWAIGRFALVLAFLLYRIDRKWIENKGGLTSPPSDCDGLFTPTNTSGTTEMEGTFYFCPKYVARMPDNVLLGIKYFIIIFAISSYLRDCRTLFKQWQNVKNNNLRVGYGERELMFKCLPGNPDGLVLQWEAYFVGHLLTPALMVAVVVLLPKATDRGADLQVAIDILNLSSMWGVILYIMFFLQLAPFFGPFAITIMRLLLDVIRFAILMFLTIVAWSAVFVSIMNTKTKQGCIPEFDGLGRTMYTMFNMSLNMVTFTDFKVVHPGFVYMLHVLGTLLVAILLYNFLIGILSNSVAEMAANMGVIVMLQHHFAAMIMETTYWPLVRHYYRRIQPRHFTCENGRIYVVKRMHTSFTNQTT